MQAKRPLPINRSDLLTFFGDSALGRGEAYFAENRVDYETIELRMPELKGYVRGSKRYPYITTVRFISRKKVWQIQYTSCTCPVYSNCKHAVALLLSAGKVFGFLDDSEPTTFSLYKEENAFTAKTAKWLQQFDLAIAAEKSYKNLRSTVSGNRFLYILQPAYSKETELSPSIFYQKGQRTGTKLKEVTPSYLLGPYSKDADDQDKVIATLIESYFSDRHFGALRFSEERPYLETCFTKMIETGRCFFRDADENPLTLGAPIKVQPKWMLTPSGKQAPHLACDDPAVKVFISPIPWYVNAITSQSGQVILPFSQLTTEVFLAAPHVEPFEAKAIKTVLEKIVPDQPEVLPVDDWQRVTVDKNPIKRLTLQSKTVTYHDEALRSKGFAFGAKAPFITITFDYGVPDVDLGSTKKEISRVEGNTILTINRNLDVERNAVIQLQQHGLEPLQNWFSPRDRFPFVPARAAYEKTISATTWFKLLNVEIPKLQKKGWEIEFDPSFTIEAVEANGEWITEIEDDGSWWFSLHLGIDVNGESVSLIPILIEALRQAPFIFGPEDLEHLNVDGKFYAPLDDGRHIALPFERVRDLLNVILDLFNRDADPDKILINPWQAAELTCVNLDSQKRLRELAQRIKQFKGIQSIEAPEGFQATLREYQKEGLGWLNFLREFEAGGILADDMGLGKTVQTLCHILIEKREGRLNYPALIVCPTSVLPNWVNEAKRFTPELKILALHGSDRQNNFEDIYDHDIVVTTYPLIHRDKVYLAKRFWTLIVLDEAQMIRNPDTLAAKCAFELKANYRVCLTGTPVENHLGDLWSQFNFLMPGYLGDQKSFQNYFRQPVEKFGDTNRLRILSQRVRPFMLRRTKSEVAHELPEKTIMMESIQLQGTQRDLYETVRVAMEARVRDEIEQKGFKRSQIVILEALLRLRQACCDPRLLGTSFTHRAKESAKLSRLTEMIAELVEENRKMLIFSQFTSMLDLIAEELNRLNIAYVEIRGDTRDRATPVARFQSGEVPVFLLSLKAGGTGLNLTAADTVIHFDPWWNPAVENQATDRAHRIGQMKPVFVYKLIATGTIEEKMLALQEKKKLLAEGIFDEKKASSINVTEEELEFLFRPISDDPTVEEAPATYKIRGGQSLELSLSDHCGEIAVCEETVAKQEHKKKPHKSTSIKKTAPLKSPKIEPEVLEHETRQEVTRPNVAKSDQPQNDPFIKALLKQGFSIEEIQSGKLVKRKNS